MVTYNICMKIYFNSCKFLIDIYFNMPTKKIYVNNTIVFIQVSAIFVIFHA